MNNTVVRTISGIGFIIIMLCGLLISKFLFAGLIMFIMTVMMHEFYTLTMNDRYRFSRVLAILACLVLFMLIFAISAYDMEPKYVSIAILPVLVVMINSLYVRDKTEFGKFGDILAKTKKKIQEVANTMEDAESKTRNIQRKLGKVDSLPINNSTEEIEINSENNEEE